MHGKNFKRSKGVNLNGILECKSPSKNAHRTVLIDALSFVSL
jgi:hypothetical protein